MTGTYRVKFKDPTGDLACTWEGIANSHVNALDIAREEVPGEIADFEATTYYLGEVKG